MAPDTDRVCNPPLQERVPILWLPLPHQLFPDPVAIEATGPFRLGGLVHPDHGGVLAVADVALKGAGQACTGKQD